MTGAADGAIFDHIISFFMNPEESLAFKSADYRNISFANHCLNDLCKEAQIEDDEERLQGGQEGLWGDCAELKATLWQALAKFEGMSVEGVQRLFTSFIVRDEVHVVDGLVAGTKTNGIVGMVHEGTGHGANPYPREEGGAEIAKKAEMTILRSVYSNTTTIVSMQPMRSKGAIHQSTSTLHVLSKEAAKASGSGFAIHG